MIIIKGANISGAVITDGVVINGDNGDKGNQRTFDEKKSEETNNVKKILIDSATINVDVSASNSSKIEARLYGQAIIDGKVNFDVKRVGDALKIVAELTGITYNGNLQLDVVVPYKMFDLISAESSSANIVLGRGVIAESIRLISTSGDLETDAEFANASIFFSDNM